MTFAKARSLVGLATYNPIVAKELRSRMRGWHAAAILSGYLCVIGGVGYLVYEEAAGSAIGVQSGTTGSGVFEALAASVMGTTAFAAPALVGNAISGERERGTLDLLFVTPLRAGRIVVGKLLAPLLFLALLVVACLPLLSVALVPGGVTITEIMEAAAFSLVVCFTFASLAMLASVLVPRAAASVALSYLFAFALAAVPLTAGYVWNELGHQFEANPIQAVTTPGPADGAETLNAFSPAAGAASLFAANGCTVLTPLFGTGEVVPTPVSCGPGAQFDVGLGPLGLWPTWVASAAFDGGIAVLALAASVWALRRQATG